MSGFKRGFLIYVIVSLFRVADGFKCCEYDLNCKNIKDKEECNDMDERIGKIYSESVCLSTDKLFDNECVSFAQAEERLNDIISDIDYKSKLKEFDKYITLYYFLQTDISSIKGNEKLLEWKKKLDKAVKARELILV